MTSIEELYPVTCPFCANAAAFPPSPSSPIPAEVPDRTKVDPNCYLLLSTPHVVAFLDILPIAPGHILLCTRKHYRTLGDLYPSSTSAQKRSDWAAQREVAERRETAAELGRWLPILSTALCKATGIEDWNIVQNNGERAAQVVPHVHFHLIPRYQEGRRGSKVDVGMLKSWKMFGRGAREDLDEEVGDEVAGSVRGCLREVLGLEGEGGEGKAKL